MRSLSGGVCDGARGSLRHQHMERTCASTSTASTRIRTRLSRGVDARPACQGITRVDTVVTRRGASGMGRKPILCKASSRPIAGQDVGPKDAPLKSLFPEEPEKPKPGAPRLKVAIVGCGLAGLSTAVELLDQGHEVEIFEARPFLGGKVASYQDKQGNHIEMGLHVFFGCYFNLFRLMAKTGAVNNLLRKDHTFAFVNTGGDVRELDFRFPLFDGKVNVGAPFHGLKAFFTTPQLSAKDKLANSLALGTSPIVRALFDPEGGMEDVKKLDNVSFSEWFLSHGGSRESINRMWDPIAYALGFIDCDDISARCMLTIFQFFATKTDASSIRMLAGSPENYLLGPIVEYVKQKGGKIHLREGCKEVLYEDDPSLGVPRVTGLRIGKLSETKVVTADAYVAALDVPGAKRLIPTEWKQTMRLFGDIDKLVGVPVITVQLRYDTWVTELNEENQKKAKGVEAVGLDNLLYSADADFSCFADLALTSPWDYYKEGEGSLLQCVITPPEKGAVTGNDYLPMDKDKIVKLMDQQVRKLFPSARNAELLWSSIVKIGQSLYREEPGLDAFRPDQKTPISNFFLAGSYTKQDYIDSMEGATLSGRLCAARVVEASASLSANKREQEITMKT